MDFHSLTRKELQSLCKLNKIPANITNVAMADALQSLDIVEGIEKFIKVSQSETVDLEESKENVEVSPPKAPTTRCRTTTRQKVKTTEPEILQPKETRTTRRTAKKLTGGVEESKTDLLETPALSSTRRKAMATSTCRNVNSQLNDCELEAKEDQKSAAPVETKSRQKVAATTTSTTAKKESTVQKAYGTRRSTRQTEKKSGEPRVRKESGKAVEIISLSDDDNVTSDEVLTVEVPKTTVDSGKSNTEVEDICNAFEELDVVVDLNEEKEDCDDVDNLKTESDEILNPHEEGDFEEEMNDVKPEPEDVSNPCENGDLEDEKHESEDMVFEEHSDIIFNNSADLESGVEVGGDDTELDAINDNTENLSESLNSVIENECSPEDEFTADIKEVSENIVGETMDANDSLSPIIEDVEDQSEVVSVKADDGFEFSSIEEKHEFSPTSTTLFDLIGQPTHVTPIRNNSSKNEMVKTPAISTTRSKAPASSSCLKVNSQMYVSNQKSECKMSSPETAVTSSRRNRAASVTAKKKETSLQEAYSSRRSTRLTEKNSSESNVMKEIEEAVKIDLMLDELNETSVEVLSVEVPENTMDADAKVEDICDAFEKLDVPLEGGGQEEKQNDGEFENLKMEADEILNPCEDGDLEEKVEMGEDDVKSETDDVIMSLCENVDFKQQTLKPVGHLDSFVEDDADIKSGGDNLDVGISLDTKDLNEEPESVNEDVFCAVSEINEVPDNNGDSTTPNELILDNTEKPKDSLNFPDEHNSSVNEKNTEDINEASENMILDNTEYSNIENKKDSEIMVDETCEGVEDLERAVVFTDNADTYFVEEKTQIPQNQSSILIDVISGPPTSMKKLSSNVVSDDKENSAIVVVKTKANKEKAENVIWSPSKISLRQLRKQLKALTLKSNNQDSNATKKEVTTTTRPALQALCENQLVGGETKN